MVKRGRKHDGRSSHPWYNTWMQHARNVNCPWRNFTEFRLWAEERGYDPKAGDQIILKTSRLYGFAPRVRKKGQVDDLANSNRTFMQSIVEEEVQRTIDEQIKTAWQTMMDRAYNQTDPLWEKIGGIGIQVCGDWHEFSEFVKWAMEHGGDRDGVELLRRDRSQDFGPGNCVFA